MRNVLLLLGCMSLISCATVFTGTGENIVVTSSPPSAMASLVCEGKPAGSGVTPATIPIRRNAGDCTLTVAKDGFEERTVLIEQGINRAYWLNMLFAPVPPSGLYVLWGGETNEQPLGIGLLAAGAAIFGTDFITGAVHQHKPDHIDVVLKPKEPQ